MLLVHIISCLRFLSLTNVLGSSNVRRVVEVHDHLNRAREQISVEVNNAKKYVEAIFFMLLTSKKATLWLIFSRKVVLCVLRWWEARTSYTSVCLSVKKVWMENLARRQGNIRRTFQLNTKMANKWIGPEGSKFQIWSLSLVRASPTWSMAFNDQKRFKKKTSQQRHSWVVV